MDRDPAIPPQGLPAPAFGQLLYRYLFFGWLFKDVSRGNLFERAAAWQHNRQCARWLLTYIRRWLVLGALFFALGLLTEVVMATPALSAFFYVPSVLTVPYHVVAGAAWVGLKVMPPPL